MVIKGAKRPPNQTKWKSFNKKTEHANWCSRTQQAYFETHASLLSQASIPIIVSRMDGTLSGILVVSALNLTK